MEAIRSWWEVPCVAHYCYIFRKPFKLPNFEIEELEDGLLLDTSTTPSKLIAELFRIFLNGIIDSDITSDNWPLMLKLHLKWRCEHLKERWNPLAGDKQYQDLDTYSRICILHKLCHWRLELDDIADLLRGVDGPTLRLDPVGRDMEGTKYWHFYGTRLYKEATAAAKKRQRNSVKQKDGSGTSTPKSGGGRGNSAKRGRPATASSGRSGRNPSREGTPATAAGRKGRGKQVSAGKTTSSSTQVGRRSARNNRNRSLLLENGMGVEEEEEDDEEAVVLKTKDNRTTEGDQREDEEDEDGSVEERKKNDGAEGELEREIGVCVVKEEQTSQVLEEVKEALVLEQAVGWRVACSTVEEWSDLMDQLRPYKHPDTKRLLRALQEFLPEVEHILTTREKQMKKRILSDLPRRMSDRIAIKSAIKEEDRQCAMEREMQREDMRRIEEEEEQVREEEAELKRQRRMEEALQRRKQREEVQSKLRQEEESNWEKAMSGELSGRRKAAIGAAESVSEVQRMAEGFLLTEERDFDLYTAMHKIVGALRKHEEGWVFDEPVTESIAPGYFEVVTTPMDYMTVEKKLEEHTYKTRAEFEADMELIYTNCCSYNGEDSEYYELAEEIRKLFHSLVKVHIEGGGPDGGDKEDGKGKRRRNESRSPSACRTPQLTSESSSEEESEEDGSDESYMESGGRSSKKSHRNREKGRVLKMPASLEQRMKLHGLGPHMSSPAHPSHHLPPHVPPHLYQHYLLQQQQQHYMMATAAAHGRMPTRPPDMYGHGYPLPPPPYMGGPGGPMRPGYGDPAHPNGPSPSGMFPASVHEHRPLYSPPAPPTHPSMMDGPRPPGMYPPPHHYPPPPPNHPAHPAHPHHAAYRQQMLYEMQCHRGMMDPRAMGMDPRAMGMDPRAMGMDPRAMGMDPRAMGMDPRARGSPKASGPHVVRAVGRKGGETGQEEDALRPATGKERKRMEQEKEEEDTASRPDTAASEDSSDKEGEEPTKTEEPVKDEQGKSATMEEHQDGEVGEKKLPSGDEGVKVEVREAEDKGSEVREAEDKGSEAREEEDKESEAREAEDKGSEVREAEDKGSEAREAEDKGSEAEEEDKGSETREAEDKGSEAMGGGSRVKTDPSADELAASRKEKKPSRKNWTPEEMERYRYHQHMTHLHILRKDAMARGYPPSQPPPPPPYHHPHPPPPPGSSEEAAAAYYKQQQHYMYGHPAAPPHHHAGYPAPGPRGDPRALEAAAHHQYWMEMQRHQQQQQYQHMMRQQQQQQLGQHKKTHQQQHSKQHQSSGESAGIAKERAAETGQEGLEEVPDYQDSLRRYALALGKEGEEGGDKPRMKERKGSEGTVVADSDKDSPPCQGHGAGAADSDSSSEGVGDSKCKEVPEPGGGGGKAGTEEDGKGGSTTQDRGKKKLHMEHYRPVSHMHPRSPYSHRLPPPPPFPGALQSSPTNGYLPYPGQYPHQPYPPPGEERNGGYPVPPHSYYPPSQAPPYPPSAYRMPFYPPPHAMMPPGEGWPKTGPAKRPASREASDKNAPAAKKPRPPSNSPSKNSSSS